MATVVVVDFVVVVDIVVVVNIVVVFVNFSGPACCHI